MYVFFFKNNSKSMDFTITITIKLLVTVQHMTVHIFKHIAHSSCNLRDISISMHIITEMFIFMLEPYSSLLNNTIN